MAQQDDKLQLSKKGKREISPFIGHELLYDYLSGSLDNERRAAVEDHVKFSRDAQLDLTKIQNGQSYADKLAETVVSQPIINLIATPTNYLTVLMQKSNFDKWPQGLKWGLEALVVVLAIVILLTVTPWQKVMQLSESLGSKEVILAEATKSGSTAPVEETPEFVDEGVKVPAKTPVVEASPVSTPTVVAKEVPTPSPKPSPSATTVAATTAATLAADQETDSPSVPSTSSGGFLYRGAIAITNIESNGPKITEKINELGGRKAGAVELGWQKTPGSMYYHFTIPEAKYQDLLTYLGTYGKPKIAKEKHPRVMPDGIVRMIITVDEQEKTPEKSENK